MSVHRALLAKRIEILDRVNAALDAGDTETRLAAKAVLGGFDVAAEVALRCDGVHVGRMFMECDRHYLDQDIDRPMCAGEFLSPAAPTEAGR